MLYAGIDISMQRTRWIKRSSLVGGALPRLPSLTAPTRAESRRGAPGGPSLCTRRGLLRPRFALPAAAGGAEASAPRRPEPLALLRVVYLLAQRAARIDARVQVDVPFSQRPFTSNVCASMTATPPAPLPCASPSMLTTTLLPRHAVDRVRPRVAGLRDELFGLDHLLDPRAARIVGHVDDVDPRGAEAGHDFGRGSFTATAIRMGCFVLRIGRPCSRARWPGYRVAHSAGPFSQEWAVTSR